MKNAPYTVSRREAGLALVAFLAHRLDLSKKKAKALLDSRNVFVNARRVWMAHHELKLGDVVTAPGPTEPTRPESVPILFQDDHYVIANKPPGILSDEKDSAESLLRDVLHLPALRAAHRLDRDTSGCLLLAKTPEAFDKALELFSHRRIRKIYHAVVAGHVQPPERTIALPIDGEPAVTHTRVLDASRAATHLAVKIETGRTHQIRRHLATLGHPELGDKTYATAIRVAPECMGIARQMLHAKSIDFVHPFTGRRVRAEAPLPGDFRAGLARLKLT
jgi:23S rRNA pseudouridine1911/1915/1917 synthase